jgi:hypothetical protein
MDLTTIIQVAIGMLFVWITLAVITSQIQEWVASLLSWRASMLEDSITQMLGDPKLKDKLYNHPLIQGLHTNNGKRKPGGIPEDKFALILFEQVMNADKTTAEITDTFYRLKKNVASLKQAESHELKDFAATLDTLLIGVEQKAGDATHAITEARTRVESWFNNSMERLGGAYRRRVQIVALVAGIAVAGVLNVDSAAIASALWKDPALRQAVSAAASQLNEPGQTQTGATVEEKLADIASSVDSLSVLSLPIGWSAENMPKDANGWGAKVIGIILSGMAGAQGAPYWFDLMKKLLNRGK